MEGLDFNQRLKYDFLFLQMGEDGRESDKVFVITGRLLEHKQKDTVTLGSEGT